MKRGFNKNILIVFSLFTILILISIISSAASTWPAYNVCCEKTKNDAWCQNSLEKDCDTSLDPITKSVYRITPTSCDATSFCKLGCCIDTAEGICMENSPQKVCQISSGTWVEDAKCNVPQCNLGCCILGDQASFVTLTRCKKMSALYGLNTNFKKDIKNEAQCIMTAYSQDKGACVFELDSQKTCRFTTRQDCTTNEKNTNSTSSKPEFFKDYLCSADELGTNCGPTTQTTCINGRDEVYFKDSCGNPANIYDANKIYAKDTAYWKKIVAKIDTCGFNQKKGSVSSKTCGNCNYLQGSMCGKGKATYGELLCKDLNCYKTENGKNYRNGESWCLNMGESGDGTDAPGNRHFRHVCVQGEETVEPCADFRNEICIENTLSSTYGNFIEAACRVNRWSDCIDQFTEKDCLNGDRRDCRWTEGFHYDGSLSKNKQNTTSTPEKAEESNQTGNSGMLIGGNVCLPNFPPGLKFWEAGDAKAVCSLGNSKQTVTYSTDLFGNKKCKDNCEVLETSWASKLNEVCISLGDCGAKSNVVGVYTEDGYVWKSNGKVINQGLLENIKESADTSTTG
jgi:hypothetical protein